MTKRFEKIAKENRYFISAKEAANLVGYTTDYVGRLARENKIVSYRKGRQWYIDIDSLKLFTLEIAEQKRTRQKELQEERQREHVLRTFQKIDATTLVQDANKNRVAALQAVMIVFVFTLFGGFAISAVGVGMTRSDISDGFVQIRGDMQSAFAFGSVTEWWSFLYEREEVPIEKTERVADESGEVFQGTQKLPQIDSRNNTLFVEKISAEQNLDVIQNSFSDEIDVVFVSESEGVITPQFVKRSEERYPFVLVDETLHGRN